MIDGHVKGNRVVLEGGNRASLQSQLKAAYSLFFPLTVSIRSIIAKTTTMEDSPFLQGSTSYSAATGPGGRHGGVHLANASGQDLLLDESIDLTEGTPRSNVVGTDDEDRFELGAPRRKEDGKGKGRLEDDVLSSTGIYAGHPNRVSQPISKPVNNAETPELDKLSLQQKHGEASSTMPFNDQQESPAGTRSQEGGDDQEEPAEKEARLRQTREQRRRDALISERDQLRQMNTVLEKATEGLERAIPKVAVSVCFVLGGPPKEQNTSAASRRGISIPP